MSINSSSLELKNKRDHKQAMRVVVTFMLCLFSTSNLRAQTFSFPYNDQSCSASASICTTLSEIKKQTPSDVTLSSVSFEGQTVKAKGQAQAYVPIGKFIENMTKVSSIKGRMMISSTSSVTDLDGKRIEQFEAIGQLVSEIQTTKNKETPIVMVTDLVTKQVALMKKQKLDCMSGNSPACAEFEKSRKEMAIKCAKPEMKAVCHEFEGI